MRRVGTMTTLPSRLNILKKPILSILRQTVPLDVLYIHMPLVTLKGLTYDIPSDFLNFTIGFKTKVVINRCKEDLGPITKLAPVLDLETDPDTYIFTFDDDVMVHRNLIKKYISKIVEHPNACLSLSGVCAGRFPFFYQLISKNTKDHPIDWIEGVHTVAYKRSFFQTSNELVSFEGDSPIKKYLVTNDDHRISAYLSSRNIKRISIGYAAKDNIFKVLSTTSSPDALSARGILTLMKEHFLIVKYFKSKELYTESSKSYYSTTFLLSCFVLTSIYLLSKRTILTVSMLVAFWWLSYLFFIDTTVLRVYSPLYN